MKIKSFKARLQTRGFNSIYDLTPQAEQMLAKSGIREGQAHFFVVGSTAGLSTVEFEPGLQKDLEELFEKLAPQNQSYHHEDTWHDGNGFSHVRASLLKPSLSVPVLDGRLGLGTWQQVILIDFDNRPRSREIIFQFMGE